MALISDTIKLEDLGRHIDSWLDTVVYQDLWEDVIITNRTIMNSGEYPEGWFNPFTMTVEELDAMREKFAGGSLGWQRLIEDKIPFLDSKAERKLKLNLCKLERVRNCGKEATRIDKNGLPYNYYPSCNQYDICAKCQHRREREHFKRLISLDGCQVIFNDRKDKVAEYTTAITYSFRLADGREVTVIDTQDKIEGAQYMNYSLAKELGSIIVTGTKTSGKLGKKDKQPEEKEQRKVVTISHIIEASLEIKEQIKREYYEKTIGFKPQTLDELEEKFEVFPGQIKITVVRETRAEAIAK